MDLRYLAHASFLINQPGFQFLTDPFLFLDDYNEKFFCHFPPLDLSPSDFGKIDFVFSSHIHEDHCHAETIRSLADRIDTVCLPAERPELEKVYAAQGLKNFCRLPNGQTIKVHEGLELTCFWEESSRPIDSLLVINAGGRIILHQNDCVLPWNLIAEIGDRFKIDYAFMLNTAFQSLFPLILKKSEPELRKLVKSRERFHLNQQLSQIRRWSPRVVIPYSQTITYFRPEQIALNGFGSMSPRDFQTGVKEFLPDQNFWMIQPGDGIDFGSDQPIFKRTKNYWGDNEVQYLANISDATAERNRTIPRFRAGNPMDIHNELFYSIEKKIDATDLTWLPVPNVQIQIEGEEQDHLHYVIDVAKGRLQVGKVCDAETPTLSVSAPANLIKLIVRGKLSAAQALYSQKFKLETTPNIWPSPEVECLSYVRLLNAIFG